MRTNPRSGFFLAIATLWVLGGIVFWRHYTTQFKSVGLERAVLSNLIHRHEEAYLLGLRDSHLGALTLRARRPQIVFFGDSHAYSGYDFPLLAAHLPLRIGSCALAGVFLENVLDFLDLVEQSDLEIHTLVVNLSPRMTWDIEERPSRIGQAKRVLTEAFSQAQEDIPHLLSGRWQKIPYFPDRNPTEYAQQQTHLASALASLSPATIRKLFGSYNLYPKQFWHDYIAKGHTLNPNIFEITRTILQRADALHIQLVFVVIPESEWLVAQYTPTQIAYFNRFLSFLKQHSILYNTPDLRHNTLPNRYFLNRPMTSDFPYSLLANKRQLKAWIAESPDSRQWHITDPDHMNPLGAHHFTQQFLPFLQEMLVPEGESKTDLLSVKASW